MVGIGLFTPLPLAIMIPFMAAQSAAIGEAFGKHYQYGKRRISAMSNEEFNKLDSHELFEQSMQSIKQAVPSMERAMASSSTLQLRIIEILAQTAKEVILKIPQIADDVIFGDDTDTGKSGVANPFVASFLTPLLGDAKKLQQLADLAAGKHAHTEQTTVKQFNKAVAKIPSPSIETLKIAQQAVNVQGPKQIQSGKSSANRLTIDQFGRVTNLDTRIKQVKRIRAPRSITTQVKKYNEEIRAWQRIHGSSRNKTKKTNAINNIRRISALIAQLKLKYII